jgi:arylsulfatase A-like enzyme
VNRALHCVALLGVIVGATNLSAAAGTTGPNVLFIAVDDLNHWVGHLARNPQTRTPNIDRLARMGVTFTRAYCAAPVCNPSRAALLSGKRPGVTGIYDNQNPYTAVLKPEESLITQFKNAGYATLGMGKIWHGGLGWPEQWTGTGGRERVRPSTVDDRSIGGIKFGVLQGDDDALQDTHIAAYGIAQLNRKHDRPFFLALGFHKPHMPWNVPKKYFDLHPLDQIQLPPHRTNDLDDVPPAGVHMAKPGGDHAQVLASGRWKEAVQAYLATISYLDGQIGRVLDAFERSDHAHWRKFALWEEATRAPFIWVAPGVTPPGGVCERTVDFMSIYPTLCSLAGLPLPGHVEGLDIRPLLANPMTPWEQPAVTTYGRNNHAVRTERWRYIRYAGGDEELYDHQLDPFEWTNLAQPKSGQRDVAKTLAKFLPQMNRPAVQGPRPAALR